MHQSTVTALDCFEHIKLNEVGVILTIEVPAQSIQQVDVFSSAAQLFMLQYIQDSLNDLEELSADSALSLVTTTFKVAEIVSGLHPVVAQGTLEPLN